MIRIINKKKHLVAVTMVIALFFSACGGDDKTSSQETITSQSFIGKLIDSAVKGVEYRCGKKIDTTDSNGTFLCHSLPISFHIGSIQLGTLSKLPFDNQVFPQDIIDVNRSEVNNPQVIKIAIILQSLDNDHNASNGIVIENYISNSFTEETILKNLSLDELKSTIQAQNEEVIFEDVQKVINHLSFSIGIKDSNEEEHNQTTSIDNTNNQEEHNQTTSIDNTNNQEEHNQTTSVDSTNNQEEHNQTTSIDNTNNQEEHNQTTSIDNSNNQEEHNQTTSIDSTNNQEEHNQTTSIDSTNNQEEHNQTTSIDSTNNQEEHNQTTSIDSTNNQEEHNQTTSIDNTNNQEEHNQTTSIDSTNNQEEHNQTTSIDNNNTLENNQTILNNEDNNQTIEQDVIPPAIPTLTFTPKTTQEDNISIEINGEINTTLYLNDINITTIDEDGKAILSLDTSGEDGIKKFNFFLKDNAQNQSETLILEITKYTPDTTAPEIPTLSVIPNATNQESITIEVHGEANATVYQADFFVGQLNELGTLSLDLNTSGNDGVKHFIITIKDNANNQSNPLIFDIIKDTIPPAENATINALSTDDTTPALSGNLPSGDNDNNTSKYTIVININGTEYEAVNNQNGTWSIPDNIINPLEEGFFSVTIIVTDEAGNSSSTTLINKIEINNTGFLIDSPIEGVKYNSGKYNGYTDATGLFKYEKGEGVTFYIGDENTGIPMGTAQTKVDPYNNQRKIITLFDLAGTKDENNPKVINMGKFLQSLDSDGDVSNGITIDERTKESIALLNLKNHIDFNEDVEIFHNSSDIYNLMNDLAGHFGEHRGLISTEDVKAHLIAVRDNNFTTQQISIEKVRGEEEIVKVLDGTFQSIGGVVEGLAYRSGNQFGRTDENGVFKYEEGKKVKFSIYQLELGITQGKAVVTPADLVPATSFNHPKPRNIIRLLNAFDAINGDSKITIDNAVRESLETYRSQIDINLPDGKADMELNIPQGEDEFGAQFEDFEMGKEILDEIDKLRG